MSTQLENISAQAITNARSIAEGNANFVARSRGRSSESPLTQIEAAEAAAVGTIAGLKAAGLYKV